MGSFIYDNRRSLSERHYVRKAGTQHYWFDFTSNKLDSYRIRYEDDFCLVLFGSETQDDAYVMPYRAVQDVFDATQVDHRGRWIGTVVKDVLRSTTSKKALLVSPYYNQFHLLGASEEAITSSPADAVVNSKDEIGVSDVQRKIRDFNSQFRDVVPYRQLAISRNIARPGLIATYVKQLRDYRCQLCGIEGFIQKTGVRYAEAYHIIELHRLISGSYCSDNLIIVCPSCRKRLQFADVTYEALSEIHVRVIVNGDQFEFERNIIGET